MTLTAAAMKAQGFRISAQVSDEQVAKAQGEVEVAYISNLIDTVDSDDAIQGFAIAQLTWLLIARRNTVATRAGGKTKLAPSLSDNADVRQADLELADMLLRKVQTLTGGIAGEPSRLCDDIAHVYFRNVYMGL